MNRPLSAAAIVIALILLGIFLVKHFGEFDHANPLQPPEDQSTAIETKPIGAGSQPDVLDRSVPESARANANVERASEAWHSFQEQYRCLSAERTLAAASKLAEQGRVGLSEKLVEHEATNARACENLNFSSASAGQALRVAAQAGSTEAQVAFIPTVTLLRYASPEEAMADALGYHAMKTEGRSYLEWAAENGNYDAMVSMGYYLMDGFFDGTPDYRGALHYFQTANSIAGNDRHNDVIRELQTRIDHP